METVSAVDFVAAALNAAQAGLHVSVPGRVLAYHPSTETVDVQVSIRRRLAATDDEEETFANYPVLLDIKLQDAQTGAFALKFPVQVGDRVMVHFADVNLAEWRASGEEAESPDPEIHGIAGAYAVLGGYPDSEAWPTPRTDAVTLGHRTGAGLVAVTQTQVELGRGPGLAPLPTLASVNAALAEVLAYAATAPGIPPPGPGLGVATGTTVTVAK